MYPIMVDAGPGCDLMATGIDLCTILAKQHRIEEVVVADVLVFHAVDINPLTAHVVYGVVLDGVAIAIQIDARGIVSYVINVMN